jgi:phage FluMu protein Com
MTTINDKAYREVRCTSCHKLIVYEYIFAGRLAFVCPRCGELNESDYRHLKNKENDAIVQREFTVHNDDQKGGE